MAEHSRASPDAGICLPFAGHPLVAFLGDGEACCSAGWKRFPTPRGCCLPCQEKHGLRSLAQCLFLGKPSQERCLHWPKVLRPYLDGRVLSWGKAVSFSMLGMGHALCFCSQSNRAPAKAVGAGHVPDPKACPTSPASQWTQSTLSFQE